MFCKNCGHELQENTLFCPVCGTRTAVDSPGTAATEAPTAAPKKKKGKFIVAGLLSVVILAGVASVGALAATGRLANVIHKTFSSPKDYLQYVTSKSVDSNLECMNRNYSAYLEKLSKTSSGQTVSCDVTIGKPLQSLLSIAYPELGDLKNVSLKAVANNQDNQANMQVTAGVNQADVATINAYMDIEKEEGYVQIPELSNAYLDFSDAFTEMNDELSTNGQSYGQLIIEVYEKLPDADAVNRIMKRYSAIPFENIESVEKSSASIEAGDIEQKCTVLTASLDGNYAYNTTQELLQALAEDDDLKDILKNVDSELYDEFSTSLEDAIDDLKTEKEEITSADIDLKMNIYVDNKGQIIGQEINGTVENEDLHICCFMPQKGTDFGYLLSAEVSGTELFALDGEGTISKNVMEGEFSLSLDSSLNPAPDYITDTEKFIKFSFSDCNLKDLKEGYANGSVEISSDSISAVAGCSLTLTSKADKDKSSLTVKVNAIGGELLTATFTAKSGASLPDFKPGSSAKVYDISSETDMEAYGESIDIEKFLKDFCSKSGLDLDISDITESFNDTQNLYDNDAYSYSDEFYNDDFYDDDWTYEDGSTETEDSFPYY